jgi:NOL1/NOP2/fmu family ribosome biogenesis protein
MKSKFNELKILSIKEKKKIEEKLKAKYGVSKIPGILLMKGQEKVFLYSGALSPKEIKQLEENIIIERVGIYFAKVVIDGGEEKIRLSIEGTHILKDQIKKNIFELTKEQSEDWMLGQQLDIISGKFGFLVMKYEDDFLGTGKASKEKIGNYIPKSRRLKSRGN